MKRLKKRITKTLSLPKDVLLQLPKASMTGRDEFFLENHKGIIEYNGQKVRVNTICGVIAVSGSGMELVEMEKDTIIIYGKIDSVKYLNTPDGETPHTFDPNG